MSVEFWYGERSQHRTEQRLLSDLYTHLGALAEHFWMVSNFRAGGADINLAVLKRTGVFLAQLKYMWSPITGGKTGPWRFQRSDGTVQQFQNPYQQARLNAQAWKEFCYGSRSSWFGEAAGEWPESRCLPRAYVVVAPDLAENSTIQVPTDVVEVIGLPNFRSDLSLDQQPGVDLGRESVRRLLSLLNVSREDENRRRPILSRSQSWGAGFGN